MAYSRATYGDRLTIRLRVGTLEALGAEAERQSTTTAEIIREALAAYLRRFGGVRDATMSDKPLPRP